MEKLVSWNGLKIKEHEKRLQKIEKQLCEIRVELFCKKDKKGGANEDY